MDSIWESVVVSSVPDLKPSRQVKVNDGHVAYTCDTNVIQLSVLVSFVGSLRSIYHW